jgi:hypothetical protein
MHQKYCLSAFTTLAARALAGLRAHKAVEIVLPPLRRCRTFSYSSL